MDKNPLPVLEDDGLLPTLNRIREHKRLKNLIILALCVALAAYLLFGVFLGIGVVSGSSMSPYLMGGELVLMWRLDGAYRQGDLVAFKPKGESEEYIKRVIGLPGDLIEIRGGLVFVNGAPLNEPNIKSSTYDKSSFVQYPLALAEGEYFLLGDQRENSYDSRNFGPVRKSEIVGRIIWLARSVNR